MSLSTITEGRRIYITGNTFPVKDKIKAMGGHWDNDRKMWWIGVQARAQVEQLVAAAGPSTYTPTPIDRNARVYRKVRYTGKSGSTRIYYVVAESKSGKYRLTTLDLSIDFWVDASACESIKVYEPVVRRGFYGRPDTTTYTTIGSIAKFIDKLRRADEEIAQGEIPAGYDVDLEDGAVKRVAECDMPANH